MNSSMRFQRSPDALGAGCRARRRVLRSAQGVALGAGCRARRRSPDLAETADRRSPEVAARPAVRETFGRACVRGRETRAQRAFGTRRRALQPRRPRINVECPVCLRRTPASAHPNRMSPLSSPLLCLPLARVAAGAKLIATGKAYCGNVIYGRFLLNPLVDRALPSLYRG
jgi:hypothetical protein